MGYERSGRDGWPAPGAGGSRRKVALFADTEDWIEKLESDAHWARTPAIREEKLESARILKDLLELAQERR